MVLTLAEANRIIEGAIAKAVELNLKINVAVVDAGGRLLAHNRMDGATWVNSYGAPGKAVAAAGYGRSSALIRDAPINRAIIAAVGITLIPDQGGLPIIRDGEILGGCGIGGGPSEQDEECVRAGLARL